MKVLVHYEPRGERALGLWWVDDLTNSPQSLYVDSKAPAVFRAKLIVFNKAESITWSEWFDLLTTRAPYTEQWDVYDSMGFTPEQLLASLNPLPVEAA